jgi:hypothetical protein
MPAHRHATNAVQFKPATVQSRSDAKLFEGERVEVLASLKARIARCLTRFDAPKEGLKRLIQIIANGLQGLTEDDLRLRERLAVMDACALLFRLAHAASFQFVAPLAFGKTLVIPGTANVQHLEHLSFLCGRWVQAIFKGTHHDGETLSFFAFSRMRSSSMAAWLIPYLSANLTRRVLASAVIRNEVDSDFFTIIIVPRYAVQCKSRLLSPSLKRGALRHFSCKTPLLSAK